MQRGSAGGGAAAARVVRVAAAVLVDWVCLGEVRRVPI